MRVRARRGGTLIYGELLLDGQPVSGESFVDGKATRYWVYQLGEPSLRLYGEWDIDELDDLDPELVQKTKAATREVLRQHEGNVWDHQLAWEIHNAIVAALEQPVPEHRPWWRRAITALKEKP